MAITAVRNRAARSIASRLTAGAVIAGLSVLVTLPEQIASACSIRIEPFVYVDELTTVLDNGGPISDFDSSIPDDPPLEIVGAVRVEVTEEVRETVDWYSGAVLQSTNVWGDAAIAPIEVRPPQRKSDQFGCGRGNAPFAGETFYYLTTQFRRPISIVRSFEDRDSEIDAILDEHFGASFVVPEATDGSTTVDFGDRGVVAPERSPTEPRTIWLITGTTAALIVGIGVGLALSSLIRLRPSRRGSVRQT